MRKKMVKPGYLILIVFMLACVCSCIGNSVINKPAYLSDDEAVVVSNYYKVLLTGNTAFWEAMNVVKGLRADGKINDYQKSLIVPKLDAFKNSLSKASKALMGYLQAKESGQPADISAINLVFNSLASAQDLLVQVLKDVTGTTLKNLEVK